MASLCTSRFFLSISLLLLLASRCGTAVGQQGNQRQHKISSSSSASSSLDPRRGVGGPSRLLREKCVLICGPQGTLPTTTSSPTTTSRTTRTTITTTTTTERVPRGTTSSPITSSPDYEEDEEDIEGQSECTNCVDEGPSINKWTMPLLKLGEKRYYLGIFFRANWFRAAQYCRYHGMHLASISSQEENDKLEKHIRDFGLGHEHFWTSGTDQAEEGQFFWMSTGRPITFTNWNTGEPNNFRYENGEEEHCLELWNRDGKGLKWNDSPCSFETFFVCEVGM
ncbi:uncharacterized protein LOC142326836 isoform X2 [Lycorma delicatula]|uniref:uncharacterized protein LOC142326836 isoform X2 n=1 Tax=Lycorma delicatula TaxID=130591 RepID=UPI003F510D43